MKSLAALLWVIVAAPAAAQLSPGQLVGSVDRATPTSGPVFVAIEPLRGTVVPIPDPAGLIRGEATAVVPARQPGAVIAAVSTLAGTHHLALVEFVGGAVSSVRPLTPDLGEPGVAVVFATDGRLALATASRLLVLPPGGGNPVLITTAPVGQRFAGIAVTDARLFALASSATGSSLILFDTAGGGATTRPIALARTTAISHDPSLGALVIGDAGGGVHLVETTRYLASPLATLPAPILSIARNSDRGDIVVATPVDLTFFAGGVPRGTIPAPPTNALAYRPYDSSVTTYGRGCGANRPAITTTGSPFPGSVDFVVRAIGASPSAPAFLLIGLAPDNVPLDALGMFGCVLLVAPLDAFPTLTTAGGAAATRLRIPPDPGLVGASLHLQWAIRSPAANRVGILLSDAARVTP